MLLYLKRFLLDVIKSKKSIKFFFKFYPYYMHKTMI